jgi:hypothetical protein
MSLTTTRLNERRAIGSDAGAMRSSARRLRKQGYTGAAEKMALEAEKSRLNDRASRGGLMRSADADIERDRLTQRKTNELLGSASDALLGTGATEGAAGRGLQTGAGATEGAAGRGLQTGASAGGGTAESFRDTEARKRQESALSGGFGRGAQMKAENLRDRQALFAEMQGEGAADRQDEFRSRAAKLGVTEEGWDAATARLAANRPKPTDDTTVSEGNTTSDNTDVEPTGPPSSAMTTPEQDEQGVIDRSNALIAESRAQRERQGVTMQRLRDNAAARPPLVPSAESNAPTATSMLDEIDTDLDEPAPPVRRGVTREQARQNVAAAKAQGKTPSYLDRKAAEPSLAETFAPIGRGARAMRSAATEAVQSARRFSDRTNQWAEDFRRRNQVGSKAQ